MKKKEVDEVRWAGYEVMSPELDPELVEECMGIIDNLDSRKADKVNWEERRLMDEATKRSGHLIHSGEDMTSEEVEAAQELDETAGATNEKEKDLMSGLGDILKEMEQLDGT
jgi:hypothetical protein